MPKVGGPGFSPFTYLDKDDFTSTVLTPLVSPTTGKVPEGTRARFLKLAGDSANPFMGWGAFNKYLNQNRFVQLAPGSGSRLDFWKSFFYPPGTPLGDSVNPGPRPGTGPIYNPPVRTEPPRAATRSMFNSASYIPLMLRIFGGR